MSTVHGAHDAPAAISGQQNRKVAEQPVDKPSRTAPPPACTDSRSVGEMVAALEELAKLLDRERRLLAEMYLRPDDVRLVRKNTAELARTAKLRGTSGEHVLTALRYAHAKLAHAERLRDWDDLAGQEMTGEAIGTALKSCLDDIRQPSRVGVRASVDARNDLVSWFSRYDEERLFGKTISYIIGKKRRATMVDEYQRWSRFERGEI